MRVVVATHNKNKLKELCKILAPLGFELLSNLDIAAPEVEEDKLTFADNAMKKAIEIANFCQLPTIADDSGLEIEALNGEPGIYSARYASTNEQRITKVLDKLQGQNNRRANFTCALAVATPSGWSSYVEGKVFGHIANTILGAGGFGYDPIFIPEGYTQSFAQISPYEKNKISHRYQAIDQALKLKLFEQLMTNS